MNNLLVVRAKFSDRTLTPQRHAGEARLSHRGHSWRHQKTGEYNAYPARITKGWQCETGIHAGELREERRVIPYGTDSP